MKTEDEGIRAVRDVRTAISAEFDDDPETLIEHYIMVQERHQDHRLRSLAAQQAMQVTMLRDTSDSRR